MDILDEPIGKFVFDIPYLCGMSEFLTWFFSSSCLRIWRQLRIACMLCHTVMSDSATPWSVARQAALSMGFFRQEYWNRLPCSFPGDLPYLGIKSASPALADRFFYHWTTWKATKDYLKTSKKRGQSELSDTLTPTSHHTHKTKLGSIINPNAKGAMIKLPKQNRRLLSRPWGRQKFLKKNTKKPPLIIK